MTKTQQIAKDKLLKSLGDAYDRMIYRHGVAAHIRRRWQRQFNKIERVRRAA